MSSKRESSSLALGLLLILIGLFFQGVNSGWLSLDNQELWPFFIIAPGLLLIALAFTTSAKNTILPGVIVTGVGLFFLMRQWGLLPWSMDLLWPVFPGLVGLGFLLTYTMGTRDKGLLVPAFILLGICLIFLAINFNLLSHSIWRYWPVVLIIGGLFLILSR